MHSRIIDLVVAVAAVGVTATTMHLVPSRAAARGADLPELLVTGSEFHFAAPDTATAGPTRVRFRSTGIERHIVIVVRVPAGHTGDEVVAGLTGKGKLPDSLVFAGGPSLPGPSGETDVVIDLEPGEYVLFCPVSSPDDHRPHMMKGMVRRLTVVPPPAGRVVHAAALPEADVRVGLFDYGYELTPMPRAGRRTFRVENRADQAHEVLLVRLAPGKRVDDVVRWVAGAPVGPAPGVPVGGTTSLTRGRVATFTADLEPGRYALLCYVPDAKDHRPHVAHGMTREIEVR